MLLYCINSAVFSHCLLLAYPSESFPILHLSELSSLMVTSIHSIVHSPWTIVMWMEVRLVCVHLNWSDPEQAPLQQVAFSANGFFYMHLEETVWFHLELGDLEVKMTVFFLRLCIACKSGCSKIAEGDWTWSANLFKPNSYDEKRQKVVWRCKNDALSQVYCTLDNPHFHLRCFLLIVCTKYQLLNSGRCVKEADGGKEGHCMGVLYVLD